MVGRLQIQPVETISFLTDVKSQVRRKQVPIFFDAALAAVDPLRKRLFLAVPAQAGLGQGSRFGAVLVEAIPAGAFSLATNRRNEQSRCSVPHAAREVLLPRDVINLLAHHVGAVSEQPVGQRPVQRLTVLGQPAVLLSHSSRGPLGRVGALPVAAAGFVGAVGLKAARRPGSVLAVQVALLAA